MSLYADSYGLEGTHLYFEGTFDPPRVVIQKALHLLEAFHEA